MSCDHARTGCVHSTHARRRWCLHSTFTAHLLRNVCSAIARRFFLARSKFDGARGVCLAHLGDSNCVRLADPHSKWRSFGVCGVSTAYLLFFFVRRASAVASPASGTGALMTGYHFSIPSNAHKSEILCWLLKIMSIHESFQLLSSTYMHYLYSVSLNTFLVIIF